MYACVEGYPVLWTGVSAFARWSVAGKAQAFGLWRESRAHGTGYVNPNVAKGLPLEGNDGSLCEG